VNNREIVNSNPKIKCKTITFYFKITLKLKFFSKNIKKIMTISEYKTNPPHLLDLQF